MGNLLSSLLNLFWQIVQQCSSLISSTSDKVPSFMEREATILRHTDENISVQILNASWWTHGEFAMVIDNVYTEKECQELIAMSEKHLKYVRNKHETLRNNSRAMTDNHIIADNIYQRIHKYIPSHWNHRHKHSLNERLRFLKYNKGEYMLPHFDGEYRKKTCEVSYLTVLLYLNDNCIGCGGETVFVDKIISKRGQNQLKVTPKTGSILIFQHKHMLHAAAKLTGRDDQVKYAIRSDIMYA
eukprot:53715_1